MSNGIDFSAVLFSNIQQLSIEPGFGDIGIDVTVEGGRLPCKDPNDPAFGACQNPGSYAFSYDYGYGRLYCGPVTNDPNDETGWQKFGLFITNSLQSTKCFGHDRPDIVHNWGQRITRADVEIYPFVSLQERVFNPARTVYGGARFSVTDWTLNANGGRYSPPIGTIILPSRNDVHASLNGFVYENQATDQHARGGRLAIDMFQEGSEVRTNTDYPIEGFASSGNGIDRESPGFYTSGPVYPGRYLIIATDMENGFNAELHRDITRPGERIDFEVSQNGPPRQISRFRTSLAKQFHGVSMRAFGDDYDDEKHA